MLVLADASLAKHAEIDVSLEASSVFASVIPIPTDKIFAKNGDGNFSVGHYQPTLQRAVSEAEAILPRFREMMLGCTCTQKKAT